MRAPPAALVATATARVGAGLRSCRIRSDIVGLPSLIDACRSIVDD
jgi:hypothetical protein